MQEPSSTPAHAPARRIATALVAATALAFGLAACDRNDERTAGQRLDSAVDRTEQAAQEAKLKMEQAAAEARASTAQATEEAKSKAQELGQEASATTSEVTANAKAAVEDAGITARVKAGLAKDEDLSAIRIEVDTDRGVVTLSGPVKSEAARERAAQIARDVDGVTSVVNNLAVNPGA
ncbi:BON domain-containing protein [Melaminivora alkalimesophila]|uniref:BON domain-containing protein n=1 Tax=Melaminivora alkalimesophila TaxID=1165852 RepID=A0A317RB38_9BURK|nr:BON domain-containing protein [Melaminivora alkalimesophila]PWW46375.1 BON domain-containing protein [Melaminivora alkalimesophila]